MQSGSLPASSGRGYRVNRAGTTYTFTHDRRAYVLTVACYGLKSVVISALIASPAGPPGVPGKVAVIAIFNVPLAVLCFHVARTRVRVSGGRVAVRDWRRTRTVDISEIRDITLDTKGNSQNDAWIPRMRLVNGEDIWLSGLSCGSALHPPVPWRLASFDTFQPLIATRDGPAGWTKDGLVSPKAGFYADPGGSAGVRYWGGGEWSPLFPADFADGPAPEFPGTVLAPLPTSGETWRYAASQARKGRNQSAAFAAGAVIVLILVVGHVVSSRQLPYLGFVLALRAFSTWRAWRRWTRLDRAAHAEPNAGSS